MKTPSPLPPAAVLAASIVAALAFTASSWASIDTTDPTLPTTGTDVNGHATGYLTASQVHTTYTAGALTVILSMAIHQPFGPVTRTNLGGGTEQEQFGSTLTADIQANGGPTDHTTATGPVTVDVFNKIGNTTGTFNTQMTQLNLSGTATDYGPYLIRIDPTNPSNGVTSVMDNGNGTFHINSFFDVFTDLSLDGGNTWIPGNSTGPGGSSVVTLEALPEPGTALCGVALCGVALLRRRRGMPLP